MTALTRPRAAPRIPRWAWGPDESPLTPAESRRVAWIFLGAIAVWAGFVWWWVR